MHGQWLAAHIPGARLHLFHDQSRLSLFRLMPRITYDLEALATGSRPSCRGRSGNLPPLRQRVPDDVGGDAGNATSGPLGATRTRDRQATVHALVWCRSVVLSGSQAPRPGHAAPAGAMSETRAS
jgi:hypothetical protein